MFEIWKIYDKNEGDGAGKVEDARSRGFQSNITGLLFEQKVSNYFVDKGWSPKSRVNKHGFNYDLYAEGTAPSRYSLRCLAGVRTLSSTRLTLSSPSWSHNAWSCLSKALRFSTLPL